MHLLLPRRLVSRAAVVRPVRLLLLLLLLGVGGATRTLAATPTFPPRNVTEPYHEDVMPDYDQSILPAMYWANVLGPPEMIGSVYVVPSTGGKPFPITDTINGVPAFTGEIVLPNSLDNPRGCTLRNRTDLDESFAGKVILVARGTCTFGTKAVQAAAVGAAGILVYSCDPSACDPRAPTTQFTEVVDIPLYAMQFADGDLLAQYIKRRNEQQLRWKDPALAAQDALDGVDTLVPLQLQTITTGPLVASERAGLRALIASLPPVDMGAEYYGGNFEWTLENLDDPSFDPCTSRLSGIWCEDGHIVEIGLITTDGIPGVGEMSPLWANFTKLRSFDAAFNSFTALPDELCTLTELVSLSIGHSEIVALPACLPSLTQLEMIYAPSCAISGALPDLSGLQKLRVLQFSANALTSLPMSLGQSVFPRLQYVNFGYNSLTVLPDGFKGHTTLAYLSLSDNAIEQELPVDAFDGCSALAVLDLQRNKLNGTMPRLVGCAALTDLFLSDNAFSGPCQVSTWVAELQTLQRFAAAKNQLVSPCRFTELLNLQSVDLAYNLLTSDTGTASELGNVAAFVAFQASQNLVSLDLSNNRIAGVWRPGYFGISPSLNVVQLSNNQINSLPSDLFAAAFTSLDVSYNNLSSWANFATLSAPDASLIYVNVQGNPLLTVPELPSWISKDTDTLATSKNQNYACPTLRSTTTKLMQFLVDPTFYGYSGCECAKGSFGKAPLCLSVPLSSTLLADGQYRSDEIGLDFLSAVQAAGSVAGVVTATPTTSLSDSWYGNSRLTLGLDTSWVIDVRGANDSLAAASRRLLGTGTALFVRLRIHLNRALFDEATDVLSVYEGDESMTGTRVLLLRGTDSLPAANASDYTSSAAYQAKYGTQLAALGSSQAYLELLVLTPRATVSFSSRAESGTHFFATYEYGTSCPTEHYFVATGSRCVPCFAANGQFFDVSQQRCRDNLVDWQPSDSIRQVVFATSGVAMAGVLASVALVAVHWKSALIRAASRSFLLLVLGFLGCWPLGALLYAALPTETTTGRFVCEARVWLTAVPLAGVLAVLLAKTNRLKSIFNSDKLVTKKVSDTDLLLMVSVLVGGAVIMLSVASGLELSYPQVAEGSGTLVGRRVASCASKDGWTAFVGVLIAYMGLLCLGAAALAFKTRNLPSLFNESSHITSSLFVLLFFGVVIVPLDVLIQDQAEAAVLIQGLGQNLIAVLLTAILFAPKAYMLLGEGTTAAAKTAAQIVMHTVANESALTSSDGAHAAGGSPAMSKKALTNGQHSFLRPTVTKQAASSPSGPVGLTSSAGLQVPRLATNRSSAGAAPGLKTYPSSSAAVHPAPSAPVPVPDGSSEVVVVHMSPAPQAVKYEVPPVSSGSPSGIGRSEEVQSLPGSVADME